MTDSLRGSFDALPYRHGSIPDSHPARIGAIARLLGHPAAAPDACRVLELGCAEGMNLVPLAQYLPGSQFVGIDFSPVQIEMAERARSVADLANVRFQCADLRDWEAEPEAFDYVIAHGVYSWVPDGVKDRLLATCARALAPGGVAYVSYNVFPSWGLLGGLRRIILGEIAHLPDGPEKIARTQLVLKSLDESLAGDDRPYAVLMRELLAEMRGKPPALLHHDELELSNDPCTIVEFAAHARRHGLQFLAEAHYASMPFEHLRPAVRTALSPLEPDFVHGQQLLDFIGNRRFRNTLLCRGESEPARIPNPDVLRECAFTTRLQVIDPRVDLQAGVPLQVVGRHDLRLSIDKPFQKAFLATLIAATPERLTYEEARRRTEDLLRRGGLPQDIDDGFLAVALYRLFALDQLDLLLAGEGSWLRAPGEKPVPTALARFQAQQALPIVNRWHETVAISANEKRWLAGAAVRIDEAALVAAGLLA